MAQACPTSSRTLRDAVDDTGFPPTGDPSCWGRAGWWYGPAVLAIDTAAPDFTLSDDGGNTVALRDLRGRWVLLWWYPKADTPG
jgi:peroxiredoxin Q/BCP